MRKIKPGNYRHFKGQKAKILGSAKHTEEDTYFAIYEHVDHEDGKVKLWARPINMFLENVERDGKIVPRFEFVSEIEPKVRVGVGVFVMHKGKVLMGKRKGSHGENSWAPPGGHLDFGETAEDCAKREIKEETGLIITNIKQIGYTQDFFKGEHKHYITLWIEAQSKSEKAELREPGKCEGWKWFSIDKIPKNLFLPTKHIIKQYYSHKK